MQIASLLISLVVATTLADECPGAVGGNWVVGNDRCYSYVSKAMSWYAAQQHCSSLGFAGSLAFLDTEEASGSARRAVLNSIGTANVPVWIWIGITDEGNEGVWKSVDGVTVENSNFRNGQPDNAGGREHYVHIHGKDWNWNDAPEGDKYSFICQVQPAQYEAVKCPMHWKQSGDKCYKYIDSPLSWDMAQKRCKVMGNGGSLAYVESEEVNNNVFESTGNKGDFWIGLTDKCHESKWSSVFGKQSTYQKWLPDEPNDMGNGEDCVHVTSTDRGWNDLGCEEKRPFVCQKSARYSYPDCPEGWIQRGENCYRYVKSRGSFTNAMTKCEEESRGASLASVRSDTDADELYEMAAVSAGGECVDNFQNFWMGVRYPVSNPTINLSD